MNVAIRRLDAPDAAALRALRLAALAAAPEAFGSSHEEESAYSLDVFRDRLSSDGRSAVFGAFSHDALVGMAGCLVSERIKTRHKAVLWGVFVQPDHRRSGVGRRLVQQAIAHAGSHARVLRADVVMANHAARQMYRGLGFAPYGIERNALCIAGRFYDEEKLALELARA